MDELEAIFDKLRKHMAGRVSESILIELDVAEIRMQQLLLRERAKMGAEALAELVRQTRPASLESN